MHSFHCALFTVHYVHYYHCFEEAVQSFRKFNFGIKNMQKTSIDVLVTLQLNLVKSDEPRMPQSVNCILFAYALRKRSGGDKHILGLDGGKWFECVPCM